MQSLIVKSLLDKTSQNRSYRSLASADLGLKIWNGWCIGIPILEQHPDCKFQYLHVFTKTNSSISVPQPSLISFNCALHQSGKELDS
jgi:hypothetical protein